MISSQLADEVKTWKSQVEALEKETAKYRDMRDNMNEALVSKVIMCDLLHSELSSAQDGRTIERERRTDQATGGGTVRGEIVITEVELCLHDADSKL